MAGQWIHTNTTVTVAVFSSMSEEEKVKTISEVLMYLGTDRPIRPVAKVFRHEDGTSQFAFDKILLIPKDEAHIGIVYKSAAFWVRWIVTDYLDYSGVKQLEIPI